MESTLGMALGLGPGCRSGHLAVNLVEPHLAEGPEYFLLEHPGANKSARSKEVGKSTFVWSIAAASRSGSKITEIAKSDLMGS